MDDDIDPPPHRATSATWWACPGSYRATVENAQAMDMPESAGMRESRKSSRRLRRRERRLNDFHPLSEMAKVDPRFEPTQTVVTWGFRQVVWRPLNTPGISPDRSTCYTRRLSRYIQTPMGRFSISVQ